MENFQKESKFIERLQTFMAEEGINDNQMTVKAGLSVGLVGKCKKSGKGMVSDNIEKILYAYPELSAEWLMRGEGEMFLVKRQPKPESVADYGLFVDTIKQQAEEIGRLKARIEELEGKGAIEVTA